MSNRRVLQSDGTFSIHRGAPGLLRQCYRIVSTMAVPARFLLPECKHAVSDNLQHINILQYHGHDFAIGLSDWLLLPYKRTFTAHQLHHPKLLPGHQSVGAYCLPRRYLLSDGAAVDAHHQHERYICKRQRPVGSVCVWRRLLLCVDGNG